MREIKFRAWDGERLREVNMLGWVDGSLDFVDTPKWSGPVDGFTFMQYTGLKDKNGVEIYEGDILRAADEYSGVIGYRSESAQYVGFNIGNKFEEEEYDTLHTEDCSFKSAEIIGNIYENPELLEGNQ